MNSGAYLVKENFIDSELLDQTKVLLKTNSWVPVWANKEYAGDTWLTVPLIENGVRTPFFDSFEICKVIESEMKCKIKHLMFYSLLPGGKLHPHRDMVGNVGWGGLRLHIPIYTNDGVIFKVSHKRVIMKPGELWALDTSYLHEVENVGNEERVHLVFDVLVNDWVKDLLPKRNSQYYTHQSVLLLLAVKKGFLSLFNAKKLKGNLAVLRKSMKQIFESKKV